MDPIKLIQCCQQGDLESFQHIYELYSKKAMGTAYLIAGHKGIAEDIVQEAFLQCYKEIKKLKEPAAFDVWFYKLLVRLAWRMSSKHKYTSSVEEFTCKGAYNEVNIETEIDFTENRLLIHESIEKLSEPLKTVIILYYFNDMTIKEISMVLGCFQGTVKSRLHNAKKVLERELCQIVEEDSYKRIYKGKECRVSD